MWRLCSLCGFRLQGPHILLTPQVVRLFTRFADHFYVRDRHVTVFSITFLHAAVLRSFFCVFLQVVHLRIRNDARRGHRMTNMLGEMHSTAPHLPGTAISSREQELFGAITF